MNELFILGELMEEPQSGYYLRSALQVSLGHHRKVSYGVIYPLLEKLEKDGLVEITTVGADGKNKKVATITEKGKKRFFELMKMPVPSGAHNADIYLIKLDVMQHLTLDEQIQLLDQFYQEQKDIIKDTQDILEKLAEENSKDHWYASKKFELRLQQANVAIEWIERFKQEMKKEW
ncbi:PadR family transcriptional regulator [Clostridium chromiireducens]|uniref:Transcriptional regulator PadR-like family protein n=1 Tax=Clostridium chromiireducens TaxID=225345 RepID=A0A1V4INX4_9CLOT|nr:PadR family transcriptional regulator [Clostridium chromiireducens]OPJ61606.1 transcriptional regulator PadR-like family protein [Clostridium chromiireducens]